MNPKRFVDKAVLITGAASGIGRATALRLASEGADVILADRNLEGAMQVRAEAGSRFGVRADALFYEASDTTSAREMISAAVALHGRLDCLINNAGIYRRDHFAKQTGEEWSQVLDVNLTSVLHIVQQALPALIAAHGNVVSTASTAALQGIAYAAAYAASKAGIIAMTKSLAAEYAPRGVRFNAICPGRIRTEIAAALAPIEDQDPAISVRPPKLAGKTFGEPEDIASAFAYLASDEACFVTGAVLAVDGAQIVG
ncbi:SDR family NAD(P)-dependent oxidoreductase [Labrys sp. La1]|uniref:SDR family NAD(P)-dependent oxidoreductase n=1 Tax=Labrys sp. La1 TaxID=3404917 RepID=UPI003EBC527A